MGALFNDAQCRDHESLQATKDWLVTALAVALRSLVLLHSAYEQRLRAVRDSRSGEEKSNSHTGSRAGDSDSSARDESNGEAAMGAMG